MVVDLFNKTMLEKYKQKNIIIKRNFFKLLKILYL